MRLSLALTAALLALVAGCSVPTAGTAAPADLTGPTNAPALLSHDVGTPTRVTIPALHVDAPVVPEGLQPDGQLAIPDVHQVGWYRGSPDPGAIGPSLLAGHVDYSGVDGAFFHLADLHPGDTIQVTGTKGSATFRVVTVATEPKATIDWRQVLANVPDAELLAITCGGPLDSTGHNYTDNIILRAVAV